MIALSTETLALALSSLRLHKTRSLLTALGIIIGVAVVIIVVAVGEGSKRKALAAIAQLGSTNVILRSVQPPENYGSPGSGSQSFVTSYGILRRDQRRIEEQLGRDTMIVPLKRVGSEIWRGAQRSSGEVYGTTPDLMRVTRLALARGRYLTDEDLASLAGVAVIGASVAERLFRVDDPLGQTIRVTNRERGQIFVVVGVLRPVGLAGGAGTALVGRDLNFDIHVPLSTATARFGDTSIRRARGSTSGESVEITELYIQAPSEDSVMPLAANVKRILDLEHAKKGDVTTIVPLELLEKARRDRAMFNALMAVIAAVSLLVGGIGIMNIMLATVTERTREIGVRRALGATRPHIVGQFLTETTLLSTIGGIIGVLIGTSAAPAIAALGRRVDALSELGDPQITLWSILLAVFVSTFVGVAAGLYPAVKAALQDPIVALRHD